MRKTYTLHDYPISSHAGIVMISDPRLTGAKRCVTDGRKILASPAIYSLFMDATSERERDEFSRHVEIITVDSLKFNWEEAFDGRSRNHSRKPHR